MPLSDLLATLQYVLSLDFGDFQEVMLPLESQTLHEVWAGPSLFDRQRHTLRGTFHLDTAACMLEETASHSYQDTTHLMGSDSDSSCPKHHAASVNSTQRGARERRPWMAPVNFATSTQLGAV